MNSRLPSPLVTSITLIYTLLPVWAITEEYTGPSAGRWNDAANWTPAAVPATADTASFTTPPATGVRLDGAASTSAHLTFGNGAGFTIGNEAGDTASIAHTAARTVKVTDARNYAVNLTHGTGSGTSSTGAFLMNSTTFDIAAGGKFTLDGRYFHNPGAVRSLTKSAGTTGGEGTLELTGDYTLTFLQCSLSAGSLLLNGTGTNARLLGLGSIGVNGTLVAGSSAANLFTGTIVAPATHANTGIRLISGTVDLNGHHLATTRIQGTASTGLVTNTGTSDATLTLGDFGSDTGLASTITAPVFGGVLQDGPTHKLGLTLTAGTGDTLGLTLTQPAVYSGPTLIEKGSSLVTPGLNGASAITVRSLGSLLVDGPLSNTAGITLDNGTLTVRGGLTAGDVTIVSGSLITAPHLTSGIPVQSLNQAGGTIGIASAGNSADKLTTSGNMTFSGGTLTVNLNSAPTAPVVIAKYGSLTGTPAVNFVPALDTTRLTAPAVDALTDNKITFSLTGTPADLVWTGATDANWNLTSVDWSQTGSGSAFFNLDRVTFPDGAANRSITLASTVTPGRMTVSANGNNDYSISGSGGIGGLAEGLLKTGSAPLALGGASTFVGPVQLQAGTLTLLSPQALGFTSGVAITGSGQLDLNGQALANSNRSFSATIRGDGDGRGAILNDDAGTPLLASGSGISGLRHLTLSGDATVGGLGNFDIGTGGTIEGGGFTLTKSGPGNVLLNGPASQLSTVISEGQLSTNSDDGFGTALLVKAGSTAGHPRTSGIYTHATALTVEDGGTLQASTSVTWNGPVTAGGNLTLKIDQVTSAAMTFARDVTIPGNLVSNGAATGGTTVFLGSLDVAGAITMTSGTLTFDGTAGALNASSIALGAANTTVNFNRSAGMAFANPVTGPGGLRQNGTGTTTLSGDNTYAGSTNVTRGSLIINGIHSGTGNVTVSSGATLGGNGALPGQVTVNGILSPGDSGTGVLTTGGGAKATLLNGTLRIETDEAETNPTDILTAAGDLTLGTDSILEFATLGTPLTGPAYVIATCAGTLTGTFGTVTGLPAGYDLVYGYDDGFTTSNIALVRAAVTPYQAWTATYFPGESDAAITGPGADPDQDGEINAMEYFLGSAPDDASSRAKLYPLAQDSDDDGTARELLLTIAVPAGTPAFTGTPAPAASHAGFTTSIEGSLQLPGFAAPVSAVAPVTTGLPAAPAGYEYRTFRLEGSDGLPASGFLRVRVTD